MCSRIFTLGSIVQILIMTLKNYMHVIKPIIIINKISESTGHALEQLLYHPLSKSYDFRKKPHNKQIPNCCSNLIDCNFITRMLFSDIYWLMFMFFRYILVYTCTYCMF